MLHSRNYKAFKSVATVGTIGLMMLFGACHGSNDTDGGIASDNLGTGNQPVSDGGFGATLSIELADGDNIIGTGEREAFFVTALDPSGSPLSFRRVFCESERGIAILEPSSGGVAFEHTGADGRMSGVLGGLTEGSYLIECRLEEGFNLVARKTLKIVGGIPDGFTGFPGAAGGNLGGGLVPDFPEAPDGATQITTALVNTNNFVDIFRDSDCDNDGNAPVTGTNDPETYTTDGYTLSVANGSDQPLTVTSVSYEVGGVSATPQAVNGVIAANGSAQISGLYTDFRAGFPVVKVFHGTNTPLVGGSFDVTFTVSGELEDGQNVDIEATVSVTHGDSENCS